METGKNQNNNTTTKQDNIFQKCTWQFPINKTFPWMNSGLESWRLVMFENGMRLSRLFSRSHRKPGRKRHGRVILYILLSPSKTKSYSSYISTDRGLQEQLLHWGRRVPTRTLQFSVKPAESFSPAVLSASSMRAHSGPGTRRHGAVSILCLWSSAWGRFYWLSSGLQRQARVTLSFV